ncbi:putative ribosomal N-acetyltransferase YdaF [mine drainage metagenome]|uniref:Putative ribosomal N-acetyltransferase YdaF n=1 Tax=mine drainage metagenome TaxID=410659 RepID=A0A1J5THA2_9ZZZZ
MNEAFSFAKDYFLEDNCVLLRPLTIDDCTNLLVFSLREPELWKYSLTTASGEGNLKHYVRTALNARETLKEYPFIVFDKKAKQYAGCTRFYDIQLQQKTLQLGYTWYGKDFWGTGLNKHCKYLLLQFAFENIGMERVEFRADINNARSIAAMKKIGCVVEGVLRSNTIKRDGTRRDSVVLSILKTEWERDVKENLHKQLR